VQAFTIVETVGAEQYQGRPQSFAAAVDDVVAQLVDKPDIGMQFFLYQRVHRLHIVPDQRLYVFQTCFPCRHSAHGSSSLKYKDV